MSLMHVDAYGMRKCKLRPILDEEPEFNKQISQYTLEFYHKIVRTPMLEFKEKLYQKWANKNKKGSEAMVNEVQQEIREKEQEYEEEMQRDYDEEEDDDEGRAHLQKKLAKRLEKITKKVGRLERSTRCLNQY